MTRRLISPGLLLCSSREIGFSRAVVDGDWVFVSGTTGFDYVTMTIAEGVVEQTDNTRGTSKRRGRSGRQLRDVVRVL